jgi:uncharacterized membrane protein YdjX (TVP38/TMEM64 family)
LGLGYLLGGPLRADLTHALSVMSDGDASALRDYILSFGDWAPVISLLLMVVQALVAPLPSFVVTFANGLAFGLFWGSVLSVAGHALAATVCFWLARAVGRRKVEALAGRTLVATADDWFARRGAPAIFLARLVPGMAFDAVSYAAGLSKLRFGPFIVATVAGTLPQTVLYVYLGHHAARYAWALLLVSVVAAGGSLLGGAIRRRRARRAAGADEAPAGGAGQLAPRRERHASDLPAPQPAARGHVRQPAHVREGQTLGTP